MADHEASGVGFVRGAAVLAAVAVGAAHLVDFGVYGLRLQAFDSLTRGSVGGIASLAALAVGTVACVPLALQRRSERRGWAFLGGALCVLLALRIAQPAHVLVVALPFTIAAFYLLWTTGEGKANRLLQEGCVVLALSFVLHAVGTRVLSAFGYGPDSWAYQVKVVLKHSGELGGWLLVAGGLVVLAARGFASHGAVASRERKLASH